MSWVNILLDTEAAEFVAALHNGDEIVPTAVTGDGQLIDASAAGIKARMQGRR